MAIDAYVNQAWVFVLLEIVEGSIALLFRVYLWLIREWTRINTNRRLYLISRSLAFISGLSANGRE